MCTQEFKSQLQSFVTHDKEKYDCVIPMVEDAKEEHNINEQELGPYMLLQPLFNAASCSYRIEAYWSYEICHGQFVRQYHEEREGKTIKFQEYYLGQFDAEAHKKMIDNWKENQKAGIKYKTTKIENVKYPYFEVEMTGGTMCDIINAPRTTVVRYVCYPHSKNEIYSFKETSSCNYEAIILTSVLCIIPALNPEVSKEVSIKCFNSPTDPHKPLSMLRQELNDLQMAAYDLRVSNKENAPELGQTVIGTGAHYIALNKISADMDRLARELWANEEKAAENPAAAQASEEVVKVQPLNPNIAMTPIKEFISGKNCLTGVSC